MMWLLPLLSHPSPCQPHPHWQEGRRESGELRKAMSCHCCFPTPHHAHPAQTCRKESGELRKAMSELETKNRTLAVNLQQREADFKQKAAAVEVRLRSFHCSAAPC